MSGRPASAYLLKALDLLAALPEDQWMSQSELMPHLWRLVPPGKALRATERMRAERQARRLGEAGERTKGRSDEFLIRVGAQRLVYDTLAHSARIERKTEDGVRYFRLRRPRPAGDPPVGPASG